MDSLGDDLLRYIAELLTNSDDSYRRIENSSESFDDDKVIYIKLEHGHRENDTDIIQVIDNAEGLSKDRLEKIFGIYGGDNAGGVNKHARGIFGQGASDVLRTSAYEKKTAMIQSFKGGHYSTLKYMMDDNLDSSIDVAEVKLRKDQENSLRNKLRIPKNGTAISFGIPSVVKYKMKTKSKLKDLIEKYPSFRYLLAQNNRKVVLIVDNEEYMLDSKKYLFNESNKVSSKDFELNFQGMRLECCLNVYKNENKNSDGTNILVIDENKTVFDNTMFDFGNSTSANNISGELEIKKLYKLCYDNLNDENNPNAIVKDNRTGFDTKNQFYIELNKKVSPLLDEILREHGTKVKNTDLMNNKKFNDALKKLNKYISSELNDSIGGGNISGAIPPIGGLKFARNHISLTKGKKYDLKLFLNPQLIFESDKIEISIEENDFIEISPLIISYGLIDVRDNIVEKNVTISANEITNEPIMIVARCREYSCNVLVNVIDLDIHYPENGFEFYKNPLIVTDNGRHTANLYIDKESIPVGSEISLESNLSLVEKIVVEEKCFIADNVGCIDVKFSGGVVGNDYYIKAKCNGKESDLKVTYIDSKNQEPQGGGLISGIKLEQSDQFFQAYYHLHTHEIIINTNNPINIHIMGSMENKNPSKPTFNKEQTKYLCDIIADQAAQILVKTQNAKKGEINVDDPGDAIEEFMRLIQKHKNQMFMDIYPAMVNISEN